MAGISDFTSGFVNVVERFKKYNSLLVLLTLIFTVMILLWPKVSGLTLILAIFVYGGLSHYAENNEEKIFLLVSLLFLALVNVGANGIRLGIDFKGGIRMPITLSHPVDSNTMQEIVSKLKARLSSLGMEQVVVKAIGNDRIFIEVPAGNEQLVNRVEKVTSTQGVFRAVVDGKVVLEGKDIIPGTVAAVPAAYLQGADWGVSFSITKAAAENFAEKVKGKANMPLFMFLDKPYNTTVILPSKWLEEEAKNLSAQYAPLNISVNPIDLYSALQKSLRDSKGVVYLALDTTPVSSLKTTQVIATKEIAEKMNLSTYNISCKCVSEKDLLPSVYVSRSGTPYPDKWKAVGLMSAPLLNPSVTDGSISLLYQITGSAPRDLTYNDKVNYIKDTEKLLISVLKGGAFPVKLYVGSKEVIPAPLGEKFLNYSIQGLIAAIIAVSLFIALRYRSMKLVVPILAITLTELIVLIATVGAFTIDLSAMAGLIAAVGVSIDAQIIITDELLKGLSGREALKKAFEIINNNVVLAILVFFPLFFTHIVEVIGFAITTILSYILGALVSRPAYAALVEKLFGKED